MPLRKFQLMSLRGGKGYYEKSGREKGDKWKRKKDFL
jgi:hypothetical protein